MESLIALLGWELSVTEEKRKPLKDKFVSLGVEVDLSKLGGGAILLSNKPGRVEGIAKQIGAIVDSPQKKMGFKEALSLRGKIAFAEGSTFCKLTGPLARLLARWSTVSFPRPITQELELQLRFAVKLSQGAGPRIIGPKRGDQPVIIFTDGACEDDEEGTSI